MPQNRFIKFFLLGLLAINIALVFVFPNKPPKIETYSFPTSPVDPQIRITFSELMDRTTVKSGFQIYPNVPGKTSWSGKSFVFTPDKNLDFGKKYEIKFSGSVRSMRGQATENSWLKDFETMPASFLFINDRGQIERYFTDNANDKKLSPDTMLVRQYDYDSVMKKIVFITTTGKIYLTDSEGSKPKELILPKDETDAIGEIKWVPFENSLLITNVGKDQTYLWEYSLDSGTSKLVKSSETLSYDFFPSPDGKQVLFISEVGSLILHDLSTAKEDLVVKDFFEHFGFSEYGGYILYTVMTDQGVFDFSNNLVLDKNNGDKEVLFKGKNVRIERPVVAPNEDFLVFEYTKDDPMDYAARVARLGIVNLATQELKLATPDTYSISTPQVSPDEKLLIFNKLKDSDQVPGWDVVKKTLITTPLYLDKLDTAGNFNGQIVDLKMEGAMVQWMY